MAREEEFPQSFPGQSTLFSYWAQEWCLAFSWHFSFWATWGWAFCLPGELEFLSGTVEAYSTTKMLTLIIWMWWRTRSSCGAHPWFTVAPSLPKSFEFLKLHSCSWRWGLYLWPHSGRCTSKVTRIDTTFTYILFLDIIWRLSKHLRSSAGMLEARLVYKTFIPLNSYHLPLWWFFVLWLFFTFFLFSFPLRSWVLKHLGCSSLFLSLRLSSNSWLCWGSEHPRNRFRASRYIFFHF